MRLLAALILTVHSALGADALDSAKMIEWVPGSTVGVIGGIQVRTNLIDVTQAPYGADKTGATDSATAISSAISAAAAGDVIYFPNGRYAISNLVSINKSDVTLRGESRDGAILMLGGSGGGITAGAGDLSAGTAVAITSGGGRGETNITLLSTSGGFSVGDLMQISRTNYSDANIRVISVTGPARSLFQLVRITSISSGTNLTFWPPLVWDFNTADAQARRTTAASLNPVFATKTGIGLEDITFTHTNTLTGASGTASVMVKIENTANSWMSNCVVELAQNYNVNVDNAVNVTITGCRITGKETEAPASNHAGLLTAKTTGLLLENTIFNESLFSAIQFNEGFCGNAVFANYFVDNWGDVNNHNTHTMMNLWEANITHNGFRIDGYFGSASHQTLFRGVFNAAFSPLLLKRWTTQCQIVGNIIGRSDYEYDTYQNYSNPSGSSIIHSGYPNIGNGSYTGTTDEMAWNFPGHVWNSGSRTNMGTLIEQAHTSTTTIQGDFSWVNTGANLPSSYTLIFQSGVDTNSYFVADDGTAPYWPAVGTSSNIVVNTPVTLAVGDRVWVGRQTAFQQLQKDDLATHRIHANYDFYNDDQVLVGGLYTELPASLLYASAPSWWGSTAWPAIDPETGTWDPIPAENRFSGAEEPPPAQEKRARSNSARVGTIVGPN